MSIKDQDWKQQHIEAIQKSLTRFSNRGKLDLEKWVINRLLKVIGVTFDKEELEEADEPVDVAFRNANFQVKVRLNKGREITTELKDKLKQVRNASHPSELLETYSSTDISMTDISMTEIVKQSCEYALKYTSHYGTLEKKNLDFVVYHNFNFDYYVTSPVILENTNTDFRSFSVVSNRYCAVVHASNDAPKFLKEKVGKVFDKPEI